MLFLFSFFCGIFPPTSSAVRQVPAHLSVADRAWKQPWLKFWGLVWGLFFFPPFALKAWLSQLFLQKTLRKRSFCIVRACYKLAPGQGTSTHEPFPSKSVGPNTCRSRAKKGMTTWKLWVSNRESTLELVWCTRTATSIPSSQGWPWCTNSGDVYGIQRALQL